MVPVRPVDGPSFDLKNSERLSGQVPGDIRYVPGERFEQCIQKHVQVAVSVLCRHPFLVLPAGVIATDRFNADFRNVRGDGSEELRDSMSASVVLGKECVPLAGFDSMQ